MTAATTLTRPRRGKKATLIGALATTMVGASLALAGPAEAAGKLTVTPSTGLGTQTVKVSGTGFTPDVELYVALCATDTLIPGDACSQASATQVTTDSKGSFSAINVKVQKSFKGWSGRPGSKPPAKVNCKGGTNASQCAIQTSRVGSGYQDIATTNVSFR